MGNGEDKSKAKPPPKPAGTREVARDQKNVIDRTTVPIVVVPGVMGSRLRIEANGTSYDWDPDSKLTMLADWATTSIRKMRNVMAAPKARILDEGSGDDVQGVDADTQRARGWRGLSKSFYGKILEALAEASWGDAFRCPVYAVGYDWRQTNKESGRALVKRVKEMLDAEGLGDKRIILVTHSMGGLVSRAACHGDPAFAKRVIGIVHTVQPAAGAAVCYSRFVEGAVDAGVIDAFMMLGRILGNEWWKYAALMSPLKGPLELLPTDAFALHETHGAYRMPELDGISPDAMRPHRWLEVFHDGRRVDLPRDVHSIYAQDWLPGVLRVEKVYEEYDRAEWEQGILEPLRDGLEKARDFHAWLGRYTHENTMIVASGAADTVVGIVLHRKSVVGRHNQVTYEWEHAPIMGFGDGTVPIMSGLYVRPTEDGKALETPGLTRSDERVTQILSNRQFLPASGTHAEIFDNTEVCDYVVRCARYLAQRSRL